jgi:homocitrate synthase
MSNPKEYQPRSFEVIDTSLREGLQSPRLDDIGKYNLSPNERIEIATALMKYGIRFMEVFSPVVNEKERSNLALLIEARNNHCLETGRPTFILAHVRCHPQDVEAALKAGVDGLNFYMGISSEAQTFNHGKRLDEIVRIARPLLEDIRRNHPRILLRFSGEDAFRTPIDDQFAVYDPIVDLVDRIGTPDTVGTTTPRLVAKRVAQLKDRYPNVPLEGHFHDDRGLSLINSITAIQAGMQYIQTSVLGMGERSGITSLTALLFNLYLEDPKLLDDFDVSQSYSLNVLFANILGIQVPTTEPVSLTNRTHSAGVHISAVLKGTEAYEAHNLQAFGINERRLLLGSLSSRRTIQYFLTNILNFVGVTEEIACAIYSQFKQRFPEMYNGEKPTHLLEEIAKNFQLTRLEKPSSHKEIL